MSEQEAGATPSEAVQEDGKRYLGRVKWFNNSTGYGFIIVTDGEKSGTDVFVHHSGVVVSQEQYRYLVQGEYVEFEFIKPSGGKHEFQAGSVSGIKGGKLMCETRNEFKEAQKAKKNDEVVPPRSVRAPIKDFKGKGPRDKDGSKEGWTYVDSSKKSKKSD